VDARVDCRLHKVQVSQTANAANLLINFITGPAFLGGLVAKFNSTGVLLMEASKRLRKIEAEISGIEDRAVPDELLLLGHAYSRRDTVLEEVDTVAYNWHACFALSNLPVFAVKVDQAR